MKEIKQFKLNNAFSAIYFFLVTSLLLMTGVARAAELDSSMFTPAEYDFSLAILSQLFGNLVSIAGGSTYVYKGNIFLGTGFDPFKDILMSFNLMCAIVAVTMLATSLSQKLTDMSEQQKTGDLTSTLFWVRVGAGGTFIVPVHQGYCVLQVLVMWLIINSVGAADHLLRVWLGVTHSANNVAVGQGTSNIDAMYQIKMPSPQVADLIYRTAEGYVCTYGIASQKVADEFHTNFDKTKSNQINQRNSKQVDITQGYENSRATNPLQSEKSMSTLDTNINSSVAGMTKDGVDANQLASNAAQKAEAELARAKADARERQTHLTESEKSAFNEAKQQEINEAKLDQAVKAIFNVDNLVGLNAEYDSPFYFGVTKTAVMNNAKNKDVQNREMSAVCGYLDFANTVNSSARQELYSNAKTAVARLQNQANNNQGAGLNNAHINRMNTAIFTAEKNEAQQKPKYDPEMVKAYLEVFNQYRARIAAESRAYVAAINYNVRFVADKDTQKWQQGPLSLDDYKKIKAEAMAVFNQRLFALSREMEGAILQKMVEHFKKTSNPNLADRYMAQGIDALPVIQAESKLTTNFIDSRNLANAMAFRDGWLSLGSMSMLLTNSINQAQTLASFAPSMGYATQDKQPYSDVIGDGRLGVNNVKYRQNAYEDVKAYYGLYEELAQYSVHPAIIRSLNPPSGSVNSLAALAFGLDLSSLQSSDRHPLIIMVEMGYSLIAASEKFLTQNAYWEARMGVNRKDARPMDGNPANITSQASMMLTTAMATMMVLGFMLAFYLPVLPFLIWIGAVLGWFVAVIEAIFIAPLWAAMHLSHDGSKLVGKAQAGYALLMALLFKAPMMVLGFIASFTLLQVYGIYLNYIFGFSIMLSLNGSFNTDEITFMSLTSILAAYGIYAIYMQIVITKIFNITTVLADQSLKWIGGPNGNLGEYGAMAGQEMSGRIQSFAQPLSTAGLQRRVEHAQQAGSADKIQVGKALDAQGVFGKERELPEASMIGSGYDNMFNNGQRSYGAHANDTIPQLTDPNERANFAQLSASAEKVGLSSGMSQNEAKQFGSLVASKGYRDPVLTNTINDWAGRELFSRTPNNGTLENNQQALMDIAQNSKSSAEMSNSLGEYVRSSGLSTSNAPMMAAKPSVNSITNANAGTQNTQETQVANNASATPAPAQQNNDAQINEEIAVAATTPNNNSSSSSVSESATQVASTDNAQTTNTSKAVSSAGNVSTATGQTASNVGNSNGNANTPTQTVTANVANNSTPTNVENNAPQENITANVEMGKQADVLATNTSGKVSDNVINVAVDGPAPTTTGPAVNSGSNVGSSNLASVDAQTSVASNVASQVSQQVSNTAAQQATQVSSSNNVSEAKTNVASAQPKVEIPNVANNAVAQEQPTDSNKA